SGAERRRKTLQPPADGSDGWVVLQRDLERALGRTGTLEEQLDRRRGHQRLDRVRVRRARERERGERVLAFGGDPEWCPAGGHDPELRAALDETGHLRGGRHDLIQVVHEQERLTVDDE